MKEKMLNEAELLSIKRLKQKKVPYSDIADRIGVSEERIRNGWRLLHLSLKREPFEVMVTGEKPIEFRKDTKWIRSRLFAKDGFGKKYDAVKFVNGYGKDKPYFIAKYLGFDFAIQERNYQYSNGLNVAQKRGDVKIYLGEILETGNLAACR